MSLQPAADLSPLDAGHRPARWPDTELLQRLPFAVYLTDADGRITFINEAAVQLWGRHPKLGRDRWCGSHRIFAADGTEVPLDRCPMATTLRSGRASAAAEVIVERPDGTRRHVLAHPQPLVDDEGRTVGAINALIDISERKAVEAQLAAATADLTQQVQALTSLHELAMRLAGMHALEPALQAILDAIVRIHGAQSGVLSLYDRERGRLQPAAAVGLDADALERLGWLSPRRDAGACGHAFASRQRTVVDDVLSDPRFDAGRDAARRFGLRAVHATPIFTAHGEVLGVLSVHFDRPRRPTAGELQFADMCARHAAEVVESARTRQALGRSERLYRAIGESIDYGVWLADAAGRRTYTSESFLRLVDLSAAQCNGFGWKAVLPPDEADTIVGAWQACVAAGVEWYCETRVRGADGTWHPVLARGVPVRDDDGATIAWAGIHLDISRMKQVEQELRRNDQRKDEFIATLAHELRNPLAPISNALQVLKRSGDAARAEQARGIMERQLQHMVRLIDDLLDVSRVNLGKIELKRERLDLRTVLASAVESARPLLQDAGHELTLDLPGRPLAVVGDATRLAQVFANLLNNAARYTPRQGHVLLAASADAQRVRVVVRDDGIGVEPELLGSIFELFVQAGRPPDGAHGGLGIGLTLVKRLVEMHDGCVSAANADGGGSEFTVELPAAPDEAHDAEAQPALPAAASGLRVLVVDDNRDSAETLALLLELLGHQTRTANDGFEALDAAAQYRPHAVLLDIGMPRLDGYEVCRRLRQQRWGRELLLVALTGWGKEDDQRRSREAGFDAHLVKPVDPQTLQQVLARLGGRAAQA